MRRKLNRSSEEMARREKISELLQALDISSMDDIHASSAGGRFALKLTIKAGL